MMLVSKLRHKIDLMINEENDPEKEDNWQVMSRVYAKVENLHQNQILLTENINFDYVISASYMVFTIRFFKNVKPKMRICFKGKTFSIKKVINKNEKDQALIIIGLEI